MERRLRGEIETADSESYWTGQIARWRSEIEGNLGSYPFQLRALQALIPAHEDAEATWSQRALAELAEVRARLELTIERVTPED